MTFQSLGQLEQAEFLKVSLEIQLQCGIDKSDTGGLPVVEG